MPKQSEPFDLTCLKALNVGAEAQWVALCAASIVVHAYAAGRAGPEAQAHAREIVQLTRRLYAALPKRDAVTAIVEAGLSRLESVGTMSRIRVRDRLVQDLLDHFHRGTPAEPL